MITLYCCQRIHFSESESYRSQKPKDLYKIMKRVVFCLFHVTIIRRICALSSYYHKLELRREMLNLGNCLHIFIWIKKQSQAFVLQEANLIWLIEMTMSLAFPIQLCDGYFYILNEKICHYRIPIKKKYNMVSQRYLSKISHWKVYFEISNI